VRTVLAGLLLAITASQVSAADVRTVVHVADHASVPRKDCEEAQRVVQRVFRTAGVVVDFVTKPRRAAANDAHHVELVIFSDAMVALEMQSGHVTRQVVGRASRPLGRAYVFTSTWRPTPEILGRRSRSWWQWSLRTRSRICTFRLTSHSIGGIMEARVGGRITRVPTFTGAQAAAMRGFLAAVERSGTGRLAQTQPAPADATTASSEDLVVMKVIADPFAD